MLQVKFNTLNYVSLRKHEENKVTSGAFLCKTTIMMRWMMPEYHFVVAKVRVLSLAGLYIEFALSDPEEISSWLMSLSKHQIS